MVFGTNQLFFGFDPQTQQIIIITTTSGNINFLETKYENGIHLNRK